MGTPISAFWARESPGGFSGTKPCASGAVCAGMGMLAKFGLAPGMTFFGRATTSYDGVVVEFESWKAVPWLMICRVDQAPVRLERAGARSAHSAHRPQGHRERGQGTTVNQVDFSPVALVGQEYAE